MFSTIASGLNLSHECSSRCCCYQGGAQGEGGQAGDTKEEDQRSNQEERDDPEEEEDECASDLGRHPQLVLRVYEFACMKFEDFEAERLRTREKFNKLKAAYEQEAGRSWAQVV